MLIFAEARSHYIAIFADSDYTKELNHEKQSFLPLQNRGYFYSQSVVSFLSFFFLKYLQPKRVKGKMAHAAITAVQGQ